LAVWLNIGLGDSALVVGQAHILPCNTVAGYSLDRYRIHSGFAILGAPPAGACDIEGLGSAKKGGDVSAAEYSSTPDCH
jgi:hypothetical protein